MICKICGKEFSKSCYLKPYEDICSSECFTENFWREIVEEKNKHVIIDGTSYFIGDENTSGMRGFSGRKFTIKMNDTGEIITTTNLWCQGEIPDKFKELLPNNAKFVD